MNPELPALLDQVIWDDLEQALLFLALLHLTVITFAGSILLARAVVPSLVYTGHAPERAARLRPVFYGLAALAGLGVVALAVLWINSLEIVYDIYGHDWY
jgi:hypothetical protein